MSRITIMLLGALVALGSTGCVDQDASLLLEGHFTRVAEGEINDDTGEIRQTGACLPPAQGVGETVAIQGFVDLGVLSNTSNTGGQPILDVSGNVVGSLGANQFTFGARATNRLSDNSRIYGQGSTRLNTNDVLITGADVTFTFGNSALTFERSFSSVVDSNGGTLDFGLALISSAADVGGLEACVRQELAQAGIPQGAMNDFKVPVFVDIKINAETLDGSNISSNTFTFPMEMCLGCSGGTNPNTPYCIIDAQ